MLFVKKLLSNEGFSFVALIVVAGLFLFGAGKPLYTTLGVCGALWLGLGFAHLSQALGEGRVKKRPAFLRAFGIIALSAIYGPFARTLFL